MAKDVKYVLVVNSVYGDTLVKLLNQQEKDEFDKLEAQYETADCVHFYDIHEIDNEDTIDINQLFNK